MGRRDDDADADDMVDLLLRRAAKRQAAGRRNLVIGLVAGGVGLLVLLAVGVTVLTVVLVNRGKNGGGQGGGAGGPVQGPGLFGPSPTREGVTWSHDELLDHLNTHGMPDLGMGSTHVGSMGGPAAVFGPAGESFSDSRDMDLTRVAYVQKLKTVQEAKDRAGAEGPDSFAWGCFYFRTKNPQLKTGIKKALGIG